MFRRHNILFLSNELKGEAADLEAAGLGCIGGVAGGAGITDQIVKKILG